jgi:hypothetical protein
LHQHSQLLYLLLYLLRPLLLLLVPTLLVPTLLVPTLLVPTLLVPTLATVHQARPTHLTRRRRCLHRRLPLHPARRLDLR